MNKTDYLLTVMAEECAEVQKVACKALRFGLDDINPATKKTNLEELQHEVNDLLAVLRLLDIKNDEDVQQQKVAKLVYWMRYSETRGKLEDQFGDLF